MKRVILKHFYTVGYKRYGHDMQQAVFDDLHLARKFHLDELQKPCNEYVSPVKAHSCQKESTVKIFQTFLKKTLDKTKEV